MKYQQLISNFERSGKDFIVMAGSSVTFVDRSPAPDKWSPRQIIVHVSDSEFVAAMRFRLIAAEPNSGLSSYDQDKWATGLIYKNQSSDVSLKAFEHTRLANLEMLRALPEAAWENVGNHVERGPTTLAQYVEHMTKHTDLHTGQIQRLREQFGAAASAG